MRSVHHLPGWIIVHDSTILPSTTRLISMIAQISTAIVSGLFIRSVPLRTNLSPTTRASSMAIWKSGFFAKMVGRILFEKLLDLKYSYHMSWWYVQLHLPRCIHQTICRWGRNLSGSMLQDNAANFIFIVQLTFAPPISHMNWSKNYPYFILIYYFWKSSSNNFMGTFEIKRLCKKGPSSELAWTTSSWRFCSSNNSTVLIQPRC